MDDQVQINSVYILLTFISVIIKDQEDVLP